MTGSKGYKCSRVDELCAVDDPGVLGEGRNNSNHNALDVAAKCELGIFAACPRTILDLSLSPALLAGERTINQLVPVGGPFKRI